MLERGTVYSYPFGSLDGRGVTVTMNQPIACVILSADVAFVTL